MAHSRVLDRAHSALVVIDVQEGYRNKTAHHDRMVRGVQTLVRAAHALAVPIVATEQYPKGIGSLLPEVSECLGAGVPVVEKLSMSCCGAPAFMEHLERLARRQLVVCGIEAHACVNQTVHDLLDGGYAVHLPVDAISARFEHDYRVGIEKMIGSGAVPASVEMICLEWVRTAAVPEFKTIHELIK